MKKNFKKSIGGLLLSFGLALIVGLAGCSSEVNEDDTYFRDETATAANAGKDAFEKVCVGCHGWSVDATWDATTDMDGEATTDDPSTCTLVDPAATENLVCKFVFDAPAPEKIPAAVLAFDAEDQDGKIAAARRDDWTGTVQTMRGYGAWMDDSEEALIIAYLNDFFGPKYSAPVTGGKSYDTVIQPIFDDNCSCHLSAAGTSGVSLADYDSVIAAVGTKAGSEVVVAGDAASSPLYQRLTGELTPQMPIGGTLTDEQIADIKVWINSGAPNGDFGATFTEVLSIFESNCSCHNSTAGASGVSLVDYDSVTTSVGTKAGSEVVVAGDSASSPLYQRLTGELTPQMPIGGTLTDEEIAKVGAWIDAGANND